MSEYISPEVKLWAFRTFLFLREVSIKSWTVGCAIASAVYGAFQPNDYVFFPEYLLPISATKVSTEGPATARPFWYYNPKTRIFSKTQDAKGFPKRFSFLSAQITFNSMNLYSLDDFLASHTFVGDMPPPLVLIGAWSLSTGVVLDKSLFDLKILVIDENGEEKSFSPWNKDWTCGLRSPMARSGNTYTGPISNVIRNVCEADRFEDNSAAAYPNSFTDADPSLRNRLLINFITTAEPVAEPMTLGPVDLSGSEMKVD